MRVLVGFEKLVVVQMIVAPRDRKLQPGLLTNETMQEHFGESFVNTCVMDMDALNNFYGETIVTAEQFMNLELSKEDA